MDSFAQKQNQEQLLLNSGVESSGNEDSDYIDDQGVFEKKLNILQIPHIILWKLINSGSLNLQDIQLDTQQAVQFILETEKKFIILAVQ